MRIGRWTTAAVACVVALAIAGYVLAQDWPQWRGPSRDGKAPGFKAPATWPKELTQKWKVTVGAGDASPVLAGDKLYVFARQGEDEVTLCLNAADGKEVWRDKNAAPAIGGPASKAHSGPRSTPAVADGKVVTLGVNGVLSCLDAATGKPAWRKDDVKGAPKFFTASSPLIVEGLVIAQLGGEGDTGAVVACELADGKEKWKCPAQGVAYASPVLATIEGVKQLVTLTSKGAVGVALADGKLLWEFAFAPTGMAYNAATPIVDGTTVIISGQGRGTKALKIAKEGEAMKATELWANPLGVQFCTPLLKDGALYAISDKGNLFCIDAKDGKAGWTDSVKLGNYGAVLDAGTAILALPNNAQLLALKPDKTAYTELAKYKAGDGATFACPAVSGNRIFVKDGDSLILWTLE